MRTGNWCKTVYTRTLEIESNPDSSLLIILHSSFYSRLNFIPQLVSYQPYFLLNSSAIFRVVATISKQPGESLWQQMDSG